MVSAVVEFKKQCNSGKNAQSVNATAASLNEKPEVCFLKDGWPDVIFEHAIDALNVMSLLRGVEPGNENSANPLSSQSAINSLLPNHLR